MLLTSFSSCANKFCSEARKAKANGSTRFCMGAAWRDLSGRKRGFERILKMVEGVRWVLFLGGPTVPV